MIKSIFSSLGISLAAIAALNSSTKSSAACRPLVLCPENFFNLVHEGVQQFFLTQFDRMVLNVVVVVLVSTVASVSAGVPREHGFFQHT